MEWSSSVDGSDITSFTPGLWVALHTRVSSTQLNLDDNSFFSDIQNSELFGDTATYPATGGVNPDAHNGIYRIQCTAANFSMQSAADGSSTLITNTSTLVWTPTIDLSGATAINNAVLWRNPLRGQGRPFAQATVPTFNGTANIGMEMRPGSLRFRLA